MKSRIALFLLAIAASVYFVPGTGARFESAKFSPSKASITFESALAGNDSAGIKWRVTNGYNIIGYNVYRLSGKDWTRINPAMIPGSYVSTSTPADFDFAYFDREGEAGASYRLEVVEVGTGNYFTDTVKTSFDSSFNAPVQGRLVRPGDGISVKNVPEGHFFREGQNELTGSQTTQFWVAAQTGAKIKVSTEGLFKVSRTDLENAGFDVNAPISDWQLYNRGIEVPIIVPNDGSYIEFLGKGIDTPESGEGVYFLVVGNSAGKRIGSRRIRNLRAPVDSQRFEGTFFRQNRFLYVSTVRNGLDGNFFGEVVGPTAGSINFDLEGFNPGSGNAELTIRVQGLSVSAHQSQFTINGLVLDPIDGINRSSSVKSFVIPNSSLLETGNTLEFSSQLGGGDFSLLDTVEIKYDRNYIASGDGLNFKSPSYRRSEITGFTDSNIRVFDVSDTDDPKVVSGLAPVAEGGSTFKVKLPGYRSRDLFAVSDAGLESADSVEPIGPSSLSSTANAANYVIITHPDFMTEAQTWETYRSNEGYQTLVASIEDVLDEFSFGESTAEGIRSFLEYAENSWATDPDYVLLVGDGSYDPRNFEGNGNFNLMPIMRADTLYEETASDDVITDFNDDGLAEIAIGRIPARIPSDVTDALAKVTTFESSLAGAPARGSLCASDHPVGYDFEALCGRIHDELPGTIPLDEVNRADPNAKTTLLASMNTGKYIVNYSGHGASGIWASTSFFGNADVPSLTNSSDLSLFTMLTCLNGYFIRPIPDSLSEHLLKSDLGGGVAVWSSSGSTTPDVQEVMAKRFFNQLGSGPDDRLGDLVNDAKATIIGGADVRRSWVLLGDPALKVKEIPPPKPPKAGS
ncbi:MAG: hypothetical protein HKN33_10950 [Pyrinomonadaceae bacterium]|nr:hypothetical protein [Pyrinomonadaceae bacterium]